MQLRSTKFKVHAMNTVLLQVYIKLNTKNVSQLVTLETENRERRNPTS